MSKIDELIAEHCPDGVEYTELKDVIDIKFGDRITKMVNMGTEYPVYGGGGVSFYTDNFNRENEYVISRFAISKSCVRKVNGKFWLMDSGFSFDVKNKEVSKDYVAYFLFNRQEEIYNCTTQSAQRNLIIEDFKKFRIPLPPLPVQEAIVEILDSFTLLEAELEAELEARKKQYEYYRNHLLTFDDAGGGRVADGG